MFRGILVVAALVVFGAIGAGPASPDTISGTLIGTVGPGFTITLTKDGSPVSVVPAGTYTLTVTDLATIHDFHIFGPGLDQVVTTVPATGTVTTTIHLAKGTYTFQCDPHQTTMFGHFTVPDTAPVAGDDSASTTSGGTVTIPVLANDSDADGDALTPSIVTPPAGGTATVNADHTITYAASSSFAGTDTFTYRDSDGTLNSAPATVTVGVQDTTPPVTTATLTPGLMNGWYASPTLTLTATDVGSGVAQTQYALDGGAWTTYTGPLSGFSTGNHFVQFQSTDHAGLVEAVQLLAFKVDAGLPSVTVTAPADGAMYPLDKVVTAKFKCTDDESGIGTCAGPVANGADVDTSTIGVHAFTATATDRAGNSRSVTHHYSVQYTWNGFFGLIGNESDESLNLVHSGDLIKIGFGLNGDRGLGVLSSVTSVPVACPAWTPHTVPAAGDGATAGLSFGVASGHYTYGWQTDGSWAGTCRQFQLTLNDGTAAHTAVFMFFA